MKTLYMKSTYLFMVFAMILGFTLTGCSDDNSGDPSTSAEFPELKEFTCNAGETKDLSFTAGADWALSSNAGWCKFNNGEFTESTISGKAGSQTVQVVITNDGQNFEKDDIVRIVDEKGNFLGVGKTQYSSQKAQEMIGKKNQKPLIHCDYLYLD